MCFINQIVRCSWTELPNKKTIAKALRRRLFSESLSCFHILDKADIFWETFLHISQMRLLKVNLLSIVTPSIFFYSTVIHDSIFEDEIFIFCFFPKVHKMTFPCIENHIFFIEPFCSFIKSLSKTYFTSSKL